MGQIASKADYARRHGVTAAAVSQWLARGHLTAPALLADGRIDIDLADAQLRERLDYARSATAMPGQPAEPGAAPPMAGPAPAALIERQRLQRIEENELRLKRLRREELERAGALVDARAAAAAQARITEEILTAVEQWLPTLAARLGVGRDGVTATFLEWREFRERQAATDAARGAALPPLVRL